MPKDRGEPRRDDAFWYEFLSRGDSNERRVRSALKLLPASPRCTLCAAPFAGVGGNLMRAIGKRPSDKNPAMCNSCFQFIIEHHGGAEIDVTMLFADIRGSTAMAETMTPAAFRERLDRFYVAATAVVQANDVFPPEPRVCERLDIGDPRSISMRFRPPAEGVAAVKCTCVRGQAF